MAENLNDLLNLHPFVRETISNKIRGTIVGSALGDAIGLYTEFLNKQMCHDAYPDGKFSLVGNVTKFCNDSHRNKFVEGSWTDDTDHALLIILSYLHSNGQDLSSLDFARRLRSWIEQGLRCLDRLPLGLGRATGSIVATNAYLTDPKGAAYKQWVNSTYTSAPNGSLMRTYPLGIICIDKTLDQTFTIATDFSLVTHADPRCTVACCIATGILRGILLGQIRKEKDVDATVEKAVAYIDDHYSKITTHATAIVGSSTDNHTKAQQDESRLLESQPPPPPFDKEELYRHTRATSYADLELDDLRKQGYVYKCLGSSIFCLRLAMRRSSSPNISLNATEDHSDTNTNTNTNINTNTISSPSKHRSGSNNNDNIHMTNSENFEDLISELVMAGGDADTNATVAGGFVGAFLGFTSLPSHWYRGLRNVNWLLDKTDALVQTMGVEEEEEERKKEYTVGSRYMYVGSADPDTSPDGGKGYLSKKQLEVREKAFMEMYLRKTIEGKGGTQKHESTGHGLIKKWKGVFK